MRRPRLRLRAGLKLSQLKKVKSGIGKYDDDLLRFLDHLDYLDHLDSLESLRKVIKIIRFSSIKVDNVGALPASRFPGSGFVEGGIYLLVSSVLGLSRDGPYTC